VTYRLGTGKSLTFFLQCIGGQGIRSERTRNSKRPTVVHNGPARALCAITEIQVVHAPGMNDSGQKPYSINI
jgi:hypothetical protein